MKLSVPGTQWRTIAIVLAWLAPSAAAQHVGVHNIVFEALPDDAVLTDHDAERVTVNVTVRWTAESPRDGVWTFLHARVGDGPWRRLAIDRMRRIGPDPLLTAGPSPACHVADSGSGAVCRAANQAAADVRWVVAIPVAPPVDPEGLEVVASGLIVSQDALPSGSGPRRFVAAAERVTDGVYADFLSTDGAPLDVRAMRVARFCAAGCSVRRVGDRYVAGQPLDTREIPMDDRAAFARWAGLDDGFRVPALR